MKRYIKHLLLAYVVVVSIALVAALPGVLGAPEVMTGGEAEAMSLDAGQDGPGGSLNTTNSQDTQPTPSSGENAALEVTPDGWQIIAPGIEYQEFHFKKSNPYGLPAPNNAYVARMVREQQEVILESSIAEGLLNPEPEGSDGFETVAGMAQRYDQNLNYWGQQWGNRNRVVVAINGDYTVELDDTTWLPQPQRGQIYSEWYARRFPEFNVKTTSTGFVWKRDRSVFINDNCVEHPADKQFVAYISSGSVFAAQEFDNVNMPREQNQFILYTPQYDATTRTSSSNSVEVLIELSRPSTIALASDMIRGVVVDIFKEVGSTPIPFDHVVLSMHGSAKAEFISYDVNVGDEVGIAQRVKNCAGGPSYDWIGSYAGVGGDYYFLKDGVQNYFDVTPRHPRTAIAYNNDYIYYIVIDGRDPFSSIGMTIAELTKFSKDVLGATHGIAEDGGGSSTMVVNGVVKNNTFCNNVFCKGKVFLPLLTKSGSNQQAEESDILENDDQTYDGILTVTDLDNGGTVDLDISSGSIQRAVVNGMLMVVVEPMTNTTTFTPGDLMQTYSTANVRLGPGLNYGILATLPADTPGTVVDHANGLNGVLATGFNWWKVDFGGGLVGWVGEALIAQPSQSSLSTQSFFSFFR